MLPTGNRTGSVQILSLASGKLVTRDNFKILPMPASVIQRLNEMARKDGRTIIGRTANSTPTPATDGDRAVRDLPTFIVPPQHSGTDQAIEIRADETGSTIWSESGGGLADDIGPQPQGQHDEETETVEHEMNSEYQAPQDMEEDRAAEQPVQPELSGRNGGDDIAPTPTQRRRDLLEFFRGHETALTVTTGRLSAVEMIVAMLEQRKRDTTVIGNANISVRDALRTRGDEAKRVIVKELQQMLDKRVWSPVFRARLSVLEQKSVIRSSMFVKAKYLPDGSFDKLKARLVAGGDQQDKTLYDELSSATVSTSAVFTMAAVSAYERRSVAVVDIGGAYLNADMKKQVPVYMRLDKTMSDFLVTLDPSYRRFLDDRGGLTVLLKKALYGCVESSSLWYENLRTTMTSLGYTRNERDVCVFNRVNTAGVQCTATVHVDDLLIMSTSKDMITQLAEGLKKRYGEISLTHGPVVNYLGMVLDFSHTGEARITMSGYIEDVLKSAGVEGVARTPGTDGLFQVREDAFLVPEEVRVWFHRIVAMILYLAKRAKPECLTAASYLAGRVTRCDSDDVEKLMRLVRYIRGSKDMGQVFRPGNSGVEVNLYVDASYGVHMDGRSHTGSCVVIGDVGAVHCRSAKQLIVTKSSTEAELVGLSDSANQGLHLRDFLSLQGYKMPPMTIFQDNMSCMALMGRGRSGGERTRHISIRYFWVKERVDRKEARIEHKRTQELYANLLTKPLQGSQFVYERGCLTGWPQPDRVTKALV
jgi:hypothetical protein